VASISKDAKGNRTIQFVGRDRKRKSIRLGKCSQRQADAVKVHVERLVHANITGHPVDPDTSRWLIQIDGQFADRLASTGLIDPRSETALGAFIDSYIAARTDVKPGTKMLYGQTRRNLLAFFPADRQLSTITPGDADGWRLYLKEQGLAENTIRRRCGRAKQFFNAAMRRKLVTENPFRDLVSNVKGNPERYYFVSRDEIAAVLDACPDSQWRVIIALARFGGLRTPSETVSLRWEDIDWQNNRMRVISPKTEHHIGGESRLVPLFPELRPYLEEAFELAEPGTEFVVTRYREATQNFGTQCARIVRRAGLNPWPKLFQNMRSTRETELADEFPMHVVCAWIGNSQPVAAQHYLQLTDEHFRRAVAGSSALHNPVQSLHETPGNDPHVVNIAQRKTPESSGDCGTLRRDAVNKSYPARIRTTRKNQWENGILAGCGSTGGSIRA